MHIRFDAHPYRFQYRFPRILVDLDRLTELSHYGIGYNRFAPVSFSDWDHGARDGRALRPWIVDRLAASGLGQEWGRVELWTFPRIWGYVFNPLSLWYCHDPSGSLKAVLFEVHNTFGEAHHYLVHKHGASLGAHIHSGMDKCFHVSPFQPLAGSYSFILDHPTTSPSVRIDYHIVGVRRFLALEQGVQRPLTRWGLQRGAWLPAWGLVDTLADGRGDPLDPLARSGSLAGWRTLLSQAPATGFRLEHRIHSSH
ncbi:protein containing DUF1365 [mine drainage metagenome]|uniref:Protein containing DUF1365 n=2 Tax=mine drainage metagenome TaxID=410659 RepID=T1BWS1_9ZZZZ